MMTLSIRQPWAWLIVNGYKNVENRTWSTQRRGPLLIHASQAMSQDEYDACRRFIASDARIEHVLDALPPAADLERGGLIGHAQFLACVKAHESPWFTGPFGLVLANTSRLPFVPLQGRLGLFQTPGIYQ